MALELPTLHNTFGNYFAWLVVFSLPCLFIYFALMRWVIKPSRLRRKWDWFAGISMVIIALVALWARTHTGQGLLFLNGARPWVVRAENAKNSEDARAIMCWIRDSGRYGINAAQDAIHALPDRKQRERLLQMLDECEINAH